MADDSKEPLYHVHTHSSGAEYWRHVIEIVAFIVAAGWAFYVFIYQERIKPAETLPQQGFSVSISHQVVHSGSEFVSLTVDMSNTGAVPYRPAGFAIAAYGIRYLPNTTETVIKSLSRNVTTLRRSLAESTPDLLASTYATWSSFGATQPAFVLMPGTDRKIHYGFAIPRNKYDAIFLKYRWCAVWGNNTRVYNPHPYRDSTGAYWFAYFPRQNPDLSERIGCRQESRDEFPL